MNSKNLLQEYCQNKKIPLPIYDTLSTDEGLWVSTVTLGDGKNYKSNPKTTKKDAEKKAAKLAYADILEANAIDVSSVTEWVDHRFTVFIDVENQPVAAMELLKITTCNPPPENIEICFVVSKNSDLFEKLSKEYVPIPHVEFLTTDVKSSHRLNTLISVHVTTNLYTANCIILSEDKFYEALKNTIDEDPELFTCTLSVTKTFNQLCSIVFKK